MKKPTKRRRARTIKEPDSERVPNVGPTPNHDAEGNFKKGNKAAAGRRPAGARDPLRRALREAVTPEDVRRIVRALIAKAAKGDTSAAGWLGDRLLGKPRQEPDDSLIAIKLPKLDSLRACSDALAQIIKATSASTLTLGEAQAAAQLVESAREGLAAVEIESRVRDIEAALDLSQTDRR